MDIGKKIKRLRIQNNLTLEELASRSELTKGFLSQLERNLTSPSISTLEDILEALGTTISIFFQEKKDEQIVFKTEDFFIDEQNEHTINWIIPNAQKNEMEPIIIDIKPNGTSIIIEPHEGEEFGYILKGKVIIVNGKEEHSIKKGETFYIKGKYTHYIKNNSGKVASVLWITTPPLF
ncbi:MAG: XRE family transcriptional regulator [Erysipelotrichaceae bacterium]